MGLQQQNYDTRTIIVLNPDAAELKSFAVYLNMSQAKECNETHPPSPRGALKME